MNLLTVPLLETPDRQDLYSMAYVRAVIAAAGFNYSKSELDRNSDDLHIEHKVSDGFIPHYGRLVVQVKCTYACSIGDDNAIHFPLAIRTYEHLRSIEIEPRILVVVLVPKPASPTEPWIECVNQHTVFRYRAYWKNLMGAESSTNQDSVTVIIPSGNSFDVESVGRLMDEMVAQGNKRL